MCMTENLEYYKVFYYAAKTGNLTAAAAELSVSQPAVSQALKQLEGALKVRLFVRAPKGIRLTPEGQVLYEYVKKGYEQFLLGEKSLASMLDLESGELTIGASDMTLKYYLLPFLERFHEQFPKVRIMVTNAPTPETLELLKNGKLDFGVVSTPFEEERFHVRRVKKIEDIYVAGRKFAEYKEQILPLQKIAEIPVISLEKHTSTRSYVDAFLKKNGVEMHPEFELATSDMIVQFALRNLGVGNVVKDFAREYLREGSLFELAFEKKIPERDICIVTQKSCPLSRAAEKFLEIAVPVCENTNDHGINSFAGEGL